MHDIVIIGGGPAGLTAALYAGRASKSVLIIEKNAFGGQMTYSPKLENYPGVPTVSGNEIAEAMVEQVLAQEVDTEYDTVQEVIRNDDGSFTVVGEYGKYDGRSVIAATGCHHRLLGVEREEEFIGDGISFCAVCDGAFYKGKSVALIGGGNSALQEAILLSDLCEQVTVIQNLPTFTGEAKLAEQVLSKKNVKVIFSATVSSLIADSALRGLVIKTESGEQEIFCDGIFVAIGLVPENQPFSSLAPLNDYGYFDSDEYCLTPTPGFFVAGDCRSKRTRQVTTATADGAVAALAACRFLEK